jgi:hypothetical protein
MALPILHSFRLVGGTALALQLGHRKSIDLDFFTDSHFELPELIKQFSSVYPQSQVARIKETALGGNYGVTYLVDGLKIDIYHWSVKFVMPLIDADNLRIASKEEIAAMKLETIMDRKDKKDFYDIAELLQLFSLKQILTFFRQRYPFFSSRLAFDALSNVYYAEEREQVEILNGRTWDEVLQIITSAKNKYLEEVRQRRL